MSCGISLKKFLEDKNLDKKISPAMITKGDTGYAKRIKRIGEYTFISEMHQSCGKQQSTCSNLLHGDSIG